MSGQGLYSVSTAAGSLQVPGNSGDSDRSGSADGGVSASHGDNGRALIRCVNP